MYRVVWLQGCQGEAGVLGPRLLCTCRAEQRQLSLTFLSESAPFRLLGEESGKADTLAVLSEYKKYSPLNSKALQMPKPEALIPGTGPQRGLPQKVSHVSALRGSSVVHCGGEKMGTRFPFLQCSSFRPWRRKGWRSQGRDV